MFYFGVDYYPEQWPEERWPEDARLMAGAGFNVVRLAEFAWARLEPQAGRYDFDWLDRAIAILAGQGMRVVLGTPTASPPPWLMTGQPELFRVREDGRRVTYGNRREYCPNHPLYHDYTRGIVTSMATHYGAHPAVIGWQIDNEFGDRCYCPVCAHAFQQWLRSRYQSLDELNQQWGTMFWSHRYGDWAEIPVPLTTGGSPNPGLALDFYRFVSDSYVAYQQMQIDILRRHCPGHFITHNFMGFKYDRLNYYDLARNLDLVAWDNYQRMQWQMQAEVDPSQGALAADTMRGLKRQNFWVMEQQAGPGGWEIVSVPPRPGELRLWAYQSIAHGADAILFFRWRTARFGTEQYWHGLLDHDGRPSRRYEEIKRMGAEIKRAGGHIYGATVRPAVALLLSYDARFAFQIQQNNPQFYYPDHLHQLYRAFYQRHVPLDVAAPAADLSAYRLVLAPALHLVSETVADNLSRFVQAGGVLVLTSRSGVKDEANAVVNRPLPGLLAELSGVEVDEYVSLAAESRNGLEFLLPELATAHPPEATIWCDVLKPNGATVVARYTRDYYAGKPAITLNQFGQGKVVYIGTLGNGPIYETLAGWLLSLAGVRRLLAAAAGVEVTERWQGERRLLFVLNHGEREQEVTLDSRYVSLLDDAAGTAPVEGTVTVPPRDVLVLERV
ncbi:MAG: beta-galactosidase [Chloroflexi bacterium]|nr:beta-galactosidase [Chloroflexota bacterium]MCI0578199.1 beta-galactosidase [Chloroflexota bacterium]MCI0645308.1 beta-galactosidase [Chloroflexota bacterium]MCI0729538.1 beta-galactosidase [Chloroflexota bacterium]